MKVILSTNEITNELCRDEFAGWSYNGARALAEYLEEYEQSTGEEIEFDPVAIRCEFTEYENVNEAAAQYTPVYWGLTYTDKKGALEYLQDHTTVIEFDGGVIIQDF
jgi:hypothetical protein